MPEIFIRLIEAAAWPMAAPKPYSPFHLLLTAAGLAAALLSAIALGKSFRKKPRKELEKSSRRLLFACGLVLMFMEAYKQCFLFYLNGFHYNWWYFPFQLCSVPMYLCLSFPRIKTAERRTVLASFLQDFGVLGAVFALAYPPGLMYPYWTLTLHSFIWHFLLFLSEPSARSPACPTGAVPAGERSFPSFLPAAPPPLRSIQPPGPRPTPICSIFLPTIRRCSPFSARSPKLWGSFPESLSIWPRSLQEAA